MARKKSKTNMIEELLQSAKNSQWCIVDIDNKFQFESNKFEINENVKQYLVLNKPSKNENGEYNNWTNEASMSQILVIDNGEEMRFFDENLIEISSDNIKIV